MLALLSNWKLILCGMGFLAVFGAGWYVKGNIDDNRLERALSAQQLQLTQQCDKQKKVTEDANESYAAQVSTITAKLNKYRMQPSKCVAITSNAANFSTSGRGYAAKNGVTDTALREYAAECEIYRTQRVTWDKWLEDQK